MLTATTRPEPLGEERCGGVVDTLHLQVDNEFTTAIAATGRMALVGDEAVKGKHFENTGQGAGLGVRLDGEAERGHDGSFRQVMARRRSKTRPQLETGSLIRITWRMLVMSFR
ncbi:MAG: hypothetical protein R3D25_22255 [Geminicoccaceae bacterium]